MDDDESNLAFVLFLVWRTAAWLVGAAGVIGALVLALRAWASIDPALETYENGDLIGLSAAAMLTLATGLGIAGGLWREKRWAKLTLVLAIIGGIALTVLISRSS